TPLVVPYATCESESLSVVHVITALDELIEPELTLEITGGFTGLLTVTEMFVPAAVLPEVSPATALSVWVALLAVVVSQERVYVGPGPTTIFPRLDPSKVNWTSFMATLSVAVADSVIVPLTVAPFTGAVMDTCGGIASE